LVKAGIPEDRIDVVYDGTAIPEHSSSGSRIIAPATSDPGKGSDLARQAASLAGVEMAFSKNLAADLPEARIFVYLTRAEGLGSGILFAMAHGVAAIASRVGGIPEIIEHEVTGLLVENDPESIAAALSRLLGDPEFAARLGANARRSVQQKFTMDIMLEGTLASYAKIGFGE
jgi:glycosyltransferase involved in cell wall biosynthesis